MQIEAIYLHGGAKGFCFMNYEGTQKEFNSFFMRFYNKITSASASIQRIESITKSFVVESVPVGEKLFYDYTLLEYYVYDVNRRPSYFGATIRLSKFYCEVPDLFFLLDTVCKKDIIGTLLSPNGATYMWTKEQIDKQLFEKVMNDIVQLSKYILQEKNFKSIQSATGEIEYNLNLIDCQPKLVEEKMVQYGRLKITKDAPLQREEKSRTEIDRLNRQWTEKYNVLHGKFNTAVNNAQRFNDKIQKLSEHLSQEQNDHRKLQKEYDEYKSKSKYRQDIVHGLLEVKPTLLRLVEFVDSLGIEKRDDAPRPKPNPRPKPKSLFCIITVIVILALCVWGIFSFKDCSGRGNAPVQENDKGITEVVVDPACKNSTEKGCRTENTQNEESKDAASKGTEPTSEEDNPNTLYRIDIKDNDSMYINQSYTLRIMSKGSTTVGNISGKWKFSKKDFNIKDSTSLEITATPLKAGKLNICFVVEGYKKPIKREIKVKEQ